MRIGWKQVFEELSPPPGGLESLRLRLIEASTDELRARRRVRATKWAVASAAACVVLWLGVVGSWPIGIWSTPHQLETALAAEGNTALVRLGLAVPASEAVTVRPSQRHRAAVERVRLDDPNVIYYRVAALVVSGPELQATGQPPIGAR